MLDRSSSSSSTHNKSSRSCAATLIGKRWKSHRPRVHNETRAQLLKRLRQEKWLAREEESDQPRTYAPVLLDSEVQALVKDLKLPKPPAGVTEAEWQKLTGYDASISPTEYKRLADLLIAEAVREFIRPKR